jgi:hypothetical protein
MYKILQSTDWSFLIGAEVIQVAIGLHDVQVAMFKSNGKGPAISIWCDFEHRRAGQKLSDSAEVHVKAATLVSLLGKKLESAAAEGEEALMLRFDNDEMLTILVGDHSHECFKVDGPEGWFIA